LEVGPGRLTEVEPGGIGRAFGLLNLNSLTRRLSMDFSDITESGFGFDSIRGLFTIAAGQASTDDLVLIGPAAQIHITGSIDLVQQTLAQQATVLPQIGSSLTLAGTLAGGPVVGAALFVADQLLPEGMARVGSYQYTIRGPWDDPDIEPSQSSSTVETFQHSVR